MGKICSGVDGASDGPATHPCKLLTHSELGLQKPVPEAPHSDLPAKEGLLAQRHDLKVTPIISGSNQLQALPTRDTC